MNVINCPPKNIVLIGFMGCGKSTVGRALQQKLGYQWLDIDHVIENRAGKSITSIFEEKGEPAFRQMETHLVREIAECLTMRSIISTGGGVVVRPENRIWLRKLGYVVWLDAPAEVILERTSKSRSRPLLVTENPLERIQQLMSERRPYYEETAHLRLDTKGLDCQEVAAGILECARYFFTHGVAVDL